MQSLTVSSPKHTPFKNKKPCYPGENHAMHFGTCTEKLTRDSIPSIITPALISKVSEEIAVENISNVVL